MNHSEAGKLGAEIWKNSLAYKEWSEGFKLRYETSPKCCKRCSTPIEYKKRANRFCSSHCSAMGNNNRQKPPKLCGECGVEFRKWGKFCSRTCYLKAKLKPVTPPTAESRGQVVRKYLLKTRPYKCSSCDLNIWRGVKIPLEVDHIDGNYQNNSEENLRLLCPNCHALTPTFKAKNKGHGRESRRIKLEEKLSRKRINREEDIL